MHKVYGCIYFQRESSFQNKSKPSPSNSLESGEETQEHFLVIKCQRHTALHFQHCPHPLSIKLVHLFCQKSSVSQSDCSFLPPKNKSMSAACCWELMPASVLIFLPATVWIIGDGCWCGSQRWETTCVCWSYFFSTRSEEEQLKSSSVLK